MMARLLTLRAGRAGVIFVVGVCAVVAIAAPLGAQGADSAGVKAAYRELRSYADTGTVRVESGVAGAPIQVEEYTFETAFEAPRKFFFLVKKSDEAGGDRYAAWCGGGDFESWWSATGVHERHGKGRGEEAMLTGSFPSAGTSVEIPSLLFQQAEMHSTLYDFVSTGVERVQLDGRAAKKLTGSSQGHFGSGKPVTVWVDAATGLVLKIVVDTPTTAPRGAVDRITIVYTPQANPALPASRFAFTPPQ